MNGGDTYVVLEHEVGKPFDPPTDDAQVVKCCGYREAGWDGSVLRPLRVLVLWTYPRR